MTDILREFDSALAGATRWFIALDRDGTLVPYAPRPEMALVDAELEELMTELVACDQLHVAVLSARSVAQLRGDFRQKRLILAGNYGMEVRFPDGRMAIHPEALRAVPYLKLVRDELASVLDLNGGIILEDHGYSLCLHWQQVPISLRTELHNAVTAIADDFPRVHFRRLVSSYEVLPNIPWDKGLAMAFIDANLPAEDSSRFYFYAGDTEADAPAFQWVDSQGGISVRVGGEDSLGARFHVREPRELRQALRYLISQRRERSAA